MKNHNKTLAAGLLSLSLAACSPPWDNQAAPAPSSSAPPSGILLDDTFNSDATVIQHPRFDGELSSPSAGAQAVAKAGSFVLYGSRLASQTAAD